MAVFTVQSGESASFQEHYQRLIEAWLREFVDKELSESHQDEKKSSVRVTDTERVVYGQVGKELRNELTPELIGQLEELQSTPIGGVVEGAGSKIIEIDGQVVLQSDSEGKVIVNSFSKDIASPLLGVNAGSPESELERAQSQTQEILPDEEFSDAGFSEESAQDDPHSKQTSILDSADAKKSERHEGGLARASSSVDELPDGSLKQMLSSQLREMRTVLQQQQMQQQQLSSALEELVRERLAKAKETSWWQQVKGTVSQAWAALKERREDHSTAGSLKSLFHSQVPKFGQVYQADSYSIRREGSSYTLTNKSGATLMQFQSTPMGVRVDRESVQLSERHYRDIKQLQVQQLRGEKLSGAFAPVGVQETEYLTRVRAVTKAMSQYAAQFGSRVQVDGKFAYKWLATPDGKVRIDAKDGRGPLLVQAQGQLRSRMSDRDLAHFEQMLPILNSVQKVNDSRATTSQRNQQLAFDRS